MIEAIFLNTGWILLGWLLGVMSAFFFMKHRALVAVKRIVSDLRDRGGLRQEWENIDSGTRAEIMRRWHRIVSKSLWGHE